MTPLLAGGGFESATQRGRGQGGAGGAIAGRNDDAGERDHRTVAAGVGGLCQPPFIPPPESHMTISRTDPFMI